MQQALHLNDLPVIAKIFHPTGQELFILTASKTEHSIPDTLACNCYFFSNRKTLLENLDTTTCQRGTVINLSNQAIELPIEKYEQFLVINLVKPNTDSSNYKSWQFNYINNPDSTIRWIYKAVSKKPIFLNLYNATGWRGAIFKNLIKFAFKFQLKNQLKSGQFWISAKNLEIENIAARLQEAQYAIFTGTKGENRKAVISFEEQGTATQFVKMPLTEQAKTLVQTEKKYLNQLAKLSLKKLVIPKAKSIGSNLMVSNVRPANIYKNDTLKDLHLLALHELYQSTTRIIPMLQMGVWKEIQQNLLVLKNTNIVNDLPSQKIAHLSQLLVNLSEQFQPLQNIPVAIAHGDFTPWNSYITKDKVHVYDWELAAEFPLLYDAFHYIFQSSILVKRIPFAAIQKEILQFKQAPTTQSLLAKFQLDFDQAYRFYLLRNISYYSAQYIQQVHLHQQAHWLVDTWIAALEATQLNTLSVSN